MLNFGTYWVLTRDLSPERICFDGVGTLDLGQFQVRQFGFDMTLAGLSSPKSQS
jgi:hypothetical protein